MLLLLNHFNISIKLYECNVAKIAFSFQQEIDHAVSHNAPFRYKLIFLFLSVIRHCYLTSHLHFSTTLKKIQRNVFSITAITPECLKSWIFYLDIFSTYGILTLRVGPSKKWCNSYFYSYFSFPQSSFQFNQKVNINYINSLTLVKLNNIFCEAILSTIKNT